MNAMTKQKRFFTKALTKAIVKQSGGVIPEQEASLTSAGIAHMLVKEGQTLNLKTVNQTAKYVVKQKTRYENGELVYVPGEGVTDTTTGSFTIEE